MDGQVLGFDSEKKEGAIRTANGERYTFSIGSWKSDRDPKQGDKVDFVAGSDGTATDIYLMKGSFNAPDLSRIGAKLGDSKARADFVAAAKDNEVVGLFLTKPHVAGAALIILGWLFTGHLFLIKHVADLHDGMDQIGTFMRGGIAFFRFLGVWILLGLYLIPVFSGWLIYRSALNCETSKNKRQAALSGLLLPILIPLLSAILIVLGLPEDLRDLVFGGASRGYGMARNSGVNFWDMIDIDFGWALMIAGSILILLQMMGIVKSFGSFGSFGKTV